MGRCVGPTRYAAHDGEVQTERREEPIWQRNADERLVFCKERSAIIAEKNIEVTNVLFFNGQVARNFQVKFQKCYSHTPVRAP